MQATVFGLVAGHFVVDITIHHAAAIPAGIPVTLVLVPVSYAALNFGMTGSVATAGLATFLWLPDLVLPGESGHPENDVIELTLVCAVAIFLGRHIDGERRERERATRFATMLLGAQEEEQRRIARELHDEPLQLLAHLARLLDEAGDFEGVCPELSERLAEARLRALDVSGRVRAVVRGLRPPALAKFGLRPALSGLVASANGVTGLEAEFEVDAPDSRLPAEVELGVFRIAQEAVNNAILHGDAHHLSVSYREMGGAVHLRVADDGCGFDPKVVDALDRGRGFGLVGMRERAEVLGGRLRIESSRENGTVVDLELRPGPSSRVRTASPASSTRDSREPGNCVAR